MREFLNIPVIRKLLGMPRYGKLLAVAGIVAMALLGVHRWVMDRADAMMNVTVEFGSDLDEKQSRAAFQVSQDRQKNAGDSESFAPLASATPFREVDVFDEDAKDWSSYFDGYTASGALVFDANGDGRLDAYFTHNNDTWVRPTGDDGVIVDRSRISGNGLYLNLGNDAEGRPIFKQAKTLAAGNDTFVEEELLIENFLFPRAAVADTARRVGRISALAVAADLNGDGRQDLVVGNSMPGMPWSHPKTQRVMGQFVRPVGREAVRTKTPMRGQGLSLIHNYQPNDDIDDTRRSARGTEPMGANSVFLNLGDRDGDGLPEWRDASRETGLEGRRHTTALLAADFDLDGDLDIFEANVMDLDYWPGGATALAGAANALYINQLAETGELRFIEQAAAMDVDGLYDHNNPVPEYHRLWKMPLLPEVYSVALGRFVPYQPDFLEIGGETSEPGQISWAAVTQDVNEDGYPDLWIANDLGFLRLYVNREGRRFEQSMNHPRARKTGYWMSLSPGDFNGDGAEDLFAGNIGGASMNLAMPLPDPFSLFDPVIASGTMSQEFFGTGHRSTHALLDGATGFTTEMDNRVRHSTVLPPDASLENNLRQFGSDGSEWTRFDPRSLDPYEFTWGSATLDVQNDGRMDLYWSGCLQGRGGGIFPIMGTGPGRLLVNATARPGALRFVDLTAEHHVFNIEELNYDSLESAGYIFRKSPLQNWGKRSMVYSHDVSVWGFQGPGIVERITNHDLIQTAENGRATVAADLNSDGFADLLLRNMGGYDSRRSNAQNLKARVDGRVAVIPAHDPNFPTPTNYEPGRTRVFLNTYSGNHWIKIRLIDDTEGALNRDAVGARVTINDRHMQVTRSGGGGFISNYVGPLLFGLDQETATSVEIRWPDKARAVTRLALPEYANGTLTIYKKGERFEWEGAREGENGINLANR